MLPAWDLPAPNPRTPAQAVQAAERQHTKPSRNWIELCAKLTAVCYGWEGSGEASANTLRSRQQLHSAGVPEPGALVFWGVARFGHVAVSDGGGWVWSNDILRVGKVDRVKISYITATWGADYKGWSLPYYPYGWGPVSPPKDVPKPKPTTTISAKRIVAAIDGHKEDWQIATVANMLWAEGYRNFTHTGAGARKWGPGKAATWKKWEKHIKIVGANNRPGYYTLKVLGGRHNVEVTQ